uniref:reverse transcriptase domain-containing protein n=1 Tax=Acinetobacter baumannii TaxID=470 RepID=UPI001C064A5F
MAAGVKHICVSAVTRSNIFFRTLPQFTGHPASSGLSCLLFNIALEGVIRSAGFDHRGTIFTRSVQLLGYADDIDIIGRSTATVSDAYTRLKRAAAGIGLEINASKTKYLLAGGSDRDRARLGASVRINNDELEVVEEFAYLGSLITS